MAFGPEQAKKDKMTNANVTTPSNATLTTAEILAGYISRSGPVAAFTDTLPATASLVAALPENEILRCLYINASTGPATLVAADNDTTVVFGPGLYTLRSVPAATAMELLISRVGDLVKIEMVFCYQIGS